MAVLPLNSSIMATTVDEGGSAAGIELTDVTTATITNNVIRALSGGRGTDVEMPAQAMMAAMPPPCS